MGSSQGIPWYWRGIIIGVLIATYALLGALIILRNDVDENRRMILDMGMRLDVESTTIKLQEMDVALIVRSGGELEMYIPEPSTPQDDLPGDVIIVAMVGVLLGNGDSEFLELINRKLEEFQSQADKDETKRPI